MSKLILSEIKKDISKWIPKTINGAELTLFLGFDNSIEGHPVIRIEIKVYTMFSYSCDNRSWCIIPYDEKLGESEEYQKYIKEKIEYRIKDMIFATIEFLNEGIKDE